MARKTAYDTVVIGSGPNGLAAAIVMAKAGRSVLVLEAEKTIGGGTRSASLTLPGYLHDVCSAVHPMALASPFFRSLPLFKHGLEWIHPRFPLAHPLNNGMAVVLDRSLDATCQLLGPDGASYRKLLSPIIDRWEAMEGDILGPLGIPSHPMAMACFGVNAIQPASRLARRRFQTEAARMLFAGLAGHSILPLEKRATSAIGLVLAAVGHLYGWPIPKGGSQRIADALASYLRSLGGEIETGVRVGSLDELPTARSILCDLTPRGLLGIAAQSLPVRYQNALKKYKYGPGVFKIDWALRSPIPWTAKECAQAGTVHIGGSLEEIERSERAGWNGENPREPFVLLTQPSLFDSTRAPEGRHIAWAYCHVPNKSAFDMTERIESQVERFAPGFKERIHARCVSPPGVLEQHNANLVGGDISGGANILGQLFFRPTRKNYSTPLRGLYLCSSSTPPGGGVHGMCGYHAARRAMLAEGQEKKMNGPIVRPAS
jgi:phytoene dehydrogenase-like protein